MAVILNKDGLSHARALIKSGSVDKSSPWSFDDATDGKKMLGPKGNDWANYSSWHLGEDTSVAKQTKDRWKYPVGKNAKVYRSALTAIRQRAGQQSATEIFKAAGELLKEIDGAAKNFYRIKAQASRYDGDTCEISIYGDIGAGYDSGVNAQSFVNDLKGLRNVTAMNIRVHSPGGSLFDGLMMYNALKAHPAEKTFYIDGIAASIASVICMAPGTVIMPDETSWLMIHDPTAQVAGGPQDLRQAADRIDQAKQSLIAAYCEKTGMSSQDISDLMSAETWMTARQAKAWGFCDEIAQPLKIAAHADVDLSRFQNVPKELKGGSKKTMEDNIDSNKNYRKDMYAERDRVTALLAIGKHFDCRDLADRAIQEGWDEDALRLKVLNTIKSKQAGQGDIHVTVENLAGKRPFNSFGDFLMSVKNAGMPGGRTDPRLFMNAASGMSEAVPSDGGFLVQQDFVVDLLNRTSETSILAARCTKIPVGANSNGVKIPAINESSRVTGSRWGGVQIYWANESDTVTSKKPKFRLLNLALNKLMGISYATDELLQDASALQAVTMNAFSSEMAHVLDDVILNGSGAGQPLGILKSGALVTVSKETGQIAKTILFENIVNMWSRLWSQGETNAVWLINRDVLPQLFAMTLAVGTGGQPVFMPPTGISGQPYGTIFGRPVISMEQCATLGTVGDILLIDPSQYILIDKGGLDAQQSIHVRFIYDEMTFRFVYRVDGQPIWNVPLTPATGSSNTLSPFITLATRA